MRLLALDNYGIEKLIERMEKESKAMKDDVLRMCWYMRGALTYNDAMLLSIDERKIISNIIKDNLETTKKTKMPFF